MKTETICREIPCCPSSGERPRYYARQLITSDDLTLEQEYFRSKLRTHNRMLHGWGVVCGALVCLAPKKKGEGHEPWNVIVKPGYALDPCGNEINIDCTRTIDVRTQGVTGVTGEPCVEAIDPWCSEVFEERNDDPLYVAVRYKQFATRPVRVQPQGCGCDDSRCEPSRWRDGYEVRILNHCPDTHMKPPDNSDLFSGSISACPDCPDDNWVVLARVTADADGAIEIDNCECRRMVSSFKDFWWACEEAQALKSTKLSEYAAGATPEEKQRHLQAFANKLSARIEGAILAYGAKAGEGAPLGGDAMRILQPMNVDLKRITLSEGIGLARVELWVCPEGAAKPIPRVEKGAVASPGTESKKDAIAGEESPGKTGPLKKGRTKDLRDTQ